MKIASIAVRLVISIVAALFGVFIFVLANLAGPTEAIFGTSVIAAKLWPGIVMFPIAFATVFVLNMKHLTTARG